MINLKKIKSPNIGLHHLRPHQQITQIGYLSTGEDPQFYIHKFFKKGWYFLEYKVDYQGDVDIAKIYIDYGTGLSESNSIILPVVANKLVKRLIYLIEDAQLLRFDPLEREGQFLIKHFAIKKVPVFFALDRLLKKQQPIQQRSSRFPLHRYWQALYHSFLANDTQRNSLYKTYNNRFQRQIPEASYENWIAKYEIYPDNEIINQEITGFSFKPLFSIVMPTYNTDAVLLQEALNSVLAQSYANWQLCIADDCSPSPHVCKILQQYADNDVRIRYIKRETNGHISAASNSALQLATGEYIVLMDHDDTLANHALYEVAKLLNEKPHLKIIYSDEDKIDEQGNRSQPHFKSDWNRDLLYSQNYVSHLGIYQRTLLEKIGGFRVGFEGSQDYDLLLRCLLHVSDTEIAHIPKILYHWRMIEGSTALGSGEKSYTTEAGIKALEYHFAEQNIIVQISSHFPNMYRVQWSLPENKPLVSLIIPTRDGYEILKQCIDSIIEKTTYQPYEIIIIDNESSCKQTLAYLKQCQRKKNIRVLPYHYPFNYSAINNYAVNHAKGEIIGLINNDIEVINPDWLTEMVSHAIRPDIGCVGAKLYYPDGKIQHAGVICGIGGVAGHSHKYFDRTEYGYFSRLHLTQNLLAVTGATLLVRKSLFLKVGGLNETDLKIAFNDIDFCLKIYNAGYRNIWTPFAELYHHESISRGFEDNPEKIARFNGEANYMLKTWADLLKSDPFYSPNLTLERDDFSIKL